MDAQKRIKIPLIIVVIIILSYVLIANNEDQTKSNSPVDAESQLADVLTQVENVGKVKVLLYFRKTNDESEIWNPFETKKNEKDGQVYSVLIVAQGGNNPEVRRLLKQLVASYYFIPEHRIIVAQMTRGKKKDES